MSQTRTPPTPVALEVAAAVLVPAASYSFLRVFADTSALTPIIGSALLSTTIAAFLRRIRAPLPLAAAGSGVLLFALIINRFAPGTARLGLIPTAATRERVDALIDELVLNFQELKTPVPALEPFVAAAMIAAWVMAFLTDWGALRLRLAFEPVLPAALLFLFAAVLGEGSRPVEVTIVFAVAVGLWAVIQRSVNLADNNTWLANDRRRGSLGVAQAGAVMTAVALVAGVVVGPRLPGAGAEEIVSLRDQGDPTRTVISPYVNIEDRLVQQQNTRLFQVTADRPSYWRMAGLDVYESRNANGDPTSLWKINASFSQQDGRLPGEADSLGGQRDDLVQTFQITALNAIWLPAAYAPAEVRDATAAVTWNADTSSLTVANDVPTNNGVEYTIVSSVPRFSSDELRQSPNDVPADIAEHFTVLPELPAIVDSEARRITAGQPTRYDQMLALQEHFRAFDYSVDLSPRVGDPIEQFLRERVGFCQQFAGTFALMARSLGAPARVAIGFTWGDPVGETEDGRKIYEVTGRQAHAWPEVWFAGLGWVAFEPTPGRGAPDAVEYTGVAAEQDSLVQVSPDSLLPTTSAPSTTASGVAGVPEIPQEDFLDPGAAGSADPAGGGLPWGTILRVLGVLALVGAYLGGVPAYRWFRRQRRRQLIESPADGVETAWAEASESLELGFGHVRRPSETRQEYASRLAQDSRVPAPPLRDLARTVTVARYHPAGLTTDDVDTADSAALEIETAIAERVPLVTRWQRMVDPRRVLKPSARIVEHQTAQSDHNGHR